eukprot:PhM_4_TR8301/c1_g5_i4/m.24994
MFERQHHHGDTSELFNYDPYSLIDNPRSILSLPAAGITLVAAEGGVWDVTDGSQPRQVLTVGRPGGMAFLPPNLLLVCDPENHRVLSTDLFLPMLKGVVVAGSGYPGFLDGPTDTAMCNTPTHVCVGPDGAVLVSDAGNHAIRMISDGLSFVRTIVGNGIAGYVDAPLKSSRVRRPGGIVYVARVGQYVFCDTGNHALRCIDFEKNTVSTIIGGHRGAGNVDGSTEHAQLCCPTHVTFSERHGLVISDKGNRVLKFIKSNRVHTPALSEPLESPAAAQEVVGSTGTFRVVDTVLRRVVSLHIVRGGQGIATTTLNMTDIDTAAGVLYRSRALTVRDPNVANHQGGGSALCSFGAELTRHDILRRRLEYNTGRQNQSLGPKTYATRAQSPKMIRDKLRHVSSPSPTKRQAAAAASGTVSGRHRHAAGEPPSELQRAFQLYVQINSSNNDNNNSNRSGGRHIDPTRFRSPPIASATVPRSQVTGRINYLQWWLLGVTCGLVSSVCATARPRGLFRRVDYERAFLAAVGSDQPNTTTTTTTLSSTMTYSHFVAAIETLGKTIGANNNQKLHAVSSTDVMYNYILPHAFQPTTSWEVLCETSVWKLFSDNLQVLLRMFTRGVLMDGELSNHNNINNKNKKWAQADRANRMMSVDACLMLFKSIGIYPTFVTRQTFYHVFSQCTESDDAAESSSVGNNNNNNNNNNNKKTTCCARSAPHSKMCFIDFLHFFTRVATYVAPKDMMPCEHVRYLLEFLDKGEARTMFQSGGRKLFKPPTSSSQSHECRRGKAETNHKTTIPLRRALRQMNENWLREAEEAAFVEETSFIPRSYPNISPQRLFGVETADGHESDEENPTPIADAPTPIKASSPTKETHHHHAPSTPPRAVIPNRSVTLKRSPGISQTTKRPSNMTPTSAKAKAPAIVASKKAVAAAPDTTVEPKAATSQPPSPKAPAIVASKKAVAAAPDTTVEPKAATSQPLSPKAPAIVASKKAVAAAPDTTVEPKAATSQP